jgi:outer membrane protein TolC
MNSAAGRCPPFWASVLARRVRLSAAVLAVVSSTATAQSAGRDSAVVAVTIDEAVELALRASPDVVRGVGATRIARADERSARGAFLPSLSLETNAIRATTPSPISQPGAFGGVADRTGAAGVTSSLDLFTAGRRGAERRRAAATVDASDAELVARRYLVALDARRAVFDVLREAELVRVARLRVTRADEGFSVAKRRHEQGIVTRSDELRARLELTDARSALAEREGNLRAARWALARVVGLDQAVDARPVDSLAPRPLPMADAALIELIARQSPSVHAAEAAERAAAADVRAARAQYAPSLQLTGGYRVLTQQEDSPLGNHPLWSLRLGLSYPLFDGWQRDEGVARARAASDEADAETRDRRRVLRAAGQRALESMRSAEQRIALALDGVEAATEDLRVVRARYQAGMATILDLVTSEANLAQAENGLVDARFDYAVARAELSALAGRSL